MFKANVKREFVPGDQVFHLPTTKIGIKGASSAQRIGFEFEPSNQFSI